MLTVFLYTFLVIFVATAIIALGSLPQWVRVDEYYRRKLFHLLLLEVVGCVIGFVAMGIRENPSNGFSEDTLKQVSRWRWDYAGQNWSTDAYFKEIDGKLVFRADTFYCNDADRKKIKITEWISKGDVKWNKEKGTMEFMGERKILPVAREVDPSLVPGTYQVMFDLAPNKSVRGKWRMLRADGVPEALAPDIILSEFP